MMPPYKIDRMDQVPARVIPADARLRSAAAESLACRSRVPGIRATFFRVAAVENHDPRSLARARGYRSGLAGGPAPARVQHGRRVSAPSGRGRDRQVARLPGSGYRRAGYRLAIQRAARRFRCEVLARGRRCAGSPGAQQRLGCETERRAAAVVGSAAPGRSARLWSAVQARQSPER